MLNLWKADRPVPSPNIIAYLMLFAWPLLCWQFWRRMVPARALVWTILGGYLLMPPLTAINFPVVPDLNKVTIPNLMALYCAVYIAKDRISFLPENWVGRLLIVLFVAAPFATVLANGDPLMFQLSTIQGMRIYDSVAAVTNQAIGLLPFFLARHYMAQEDGAKTLLAALVAAGLIYSVPMIIEARFSPQMNVWVYGFFQHDFFQTIRQDGFRPVVFLPHGLWVAFFAVMCYVAAIVRFADYPPEERPKALIVLLFLAYLVLVCKSLGPLLYAIGLTGLILLAPWRIQVLVASVLAAIVLTYPMLRGAGLVPLDQIMDFARGLSADRAESLLFRIENEEQLLARAMERPLFGWGGYGRAFLHDPVTGELTTIADGMWVITLGEYGWLGYIASFGLTALPLLALGREAASKHAAPLNRYTAGLALILAVNMVDLLPNATQIPFTWLMAGALLGQAERMRHLRLANQQSFARAGLHGGKLKRTVI